MSVGPLGGLAASAAGAPYAQTKGADVERAQQETSNQQRKVSNDLKADKAAGIGETDGEDNLTSDRDADGRRLWEQTEEHPGESAETDADQDEESAEGPRRRSKDASGESGTRLDLTG